MHSRGLIFNLGESGFALTEQIWRFSLTWSGIPLQNRFLPPAGGSIIDRPKADSLLLAAVRLLGGRRGFPAAGGKGPHAVFLGPELLIFSSDVKSFYFFITKLKNRVRTRVVRLLENSLTLCLYSVFFNRSSLKPRSISISCYP